MILSRGRIFVYIVTMGKEWGSCVFYDVENQFELGFLIEFAKSNSILIRLNLKCQIEMNRIPFEMQIKF